MKKVSKTNIFIVTGIFAFGFSFFLAFDLQQYWNIEYLKSTKYLFISYYYDNPLVVIISFFLSYVIVTTFSLPLALTMTVAAGAIFGFSIGTILISFASTIGATLAMLISRYLMRDYLQRRFKKQMQIINGGIEKDGSYYLFALRLLPVIPFFVINIGMGLTQFKTTTFFWVSQLGMLPGTMIYINAGSEFAKIQTLGDILSPSLTASLVTLGIFPLLVRRVLSVVENKKK